MRAFEYAWTNNFTVGVEGRYTWYGTERLAAGPLAVFIVPPRPYLFVISNTYRDVRLETAEILIKANWKFGPGCRGREVLILLKSASLSKPRPSGRGFFVAAGLALSQPITE